ncbi:MAG: molybdate ABC transporter permease subunit [Moraxella sp.]|nr:molybdate ABC transporter permease subunit [Moraxella sp.]
MLSPDEWQVVHLSFKVASLSLMVNLIPAILVGFWLARKEFWGKSLVETLVFLPLVLPPVVPGYLLLVLFGSQGVIGKHLAEFGIEFAFNYKGAVLASCVMGFPLMVQSVRLAIELIDKQLEIVAMSLGASRLQTFFGITLPLSSVGILVGAILSFCRSLGEFGATITFVGNIAGETRTLPLAIYGLMNEPDSEAQILRLLILSITMAFLALWLSQWYARVQRKRLQHG